MSPRSLRVNLLSMLCGLVAAVSCQAQSAPASPSGGSASPSGQAALTLKWKDNSTNEDGFAVFNYSGTTVGSLLGTVAPNTTTVTLNSQSPGSSPQFAVFSYRVKTGTTDEGVFSATGTVTPKVRIPDYLQRGAWQGLVGVPLTLTLEPTNAEGVTTTKVDSPLWLSYDAATKSLSGTPTQPGIVTIPVTMTYADGFVLKQSVVVRVLPQTSGPVAKKSTVLPPLEMVLGEISLNLADYFEDPDAVKGARVETSKGNLNVVLYAAQTPATSANFLAYAGTGASGRYDGTIFHRSESNFVLQGGGYYPSGGSNFTKITAFPAIANEAGLENSRGTLAMAKIAGNPNSATAEWFINLNDNRSNLDRQNGGFTVFGRVAGSDGMDLVDDLAELPKGNYPTATVGGTAAGDLLANCPMDATDAPAEMDQSKLVRIQRIREVPVLGYEIIDAGDPMVAVPNLAGGVLNIVPVGPGTTRVILKVTDLDGNDLEQSVELTVPAPSNKRIGDAFHLDLSLLKKGEATSMTVSGLPAGLTFNPSTRVVSGVFAGPVGNFNIVIRMLKGTSILRTLTLPVTVGKFPSALLGSYDVLLESRINDLDHPMGLCRMTVSAGKWTASLQMPGQSGARSARGVFSLDAGLPTCRIVAVFPATKATTTAAAMPATSVTCLLQGTTELVSGSFAAGSLTGTTRGFRLAKGTTLPYATHNLTLALMPAEANDGTTAPGGFGWANGTVGSNGVINLIGQLGDAQKASFSLGLSATGQAILWAQPYKNKYSNIGGVITLGHLGSFVRGLSDEHLDDGLAWIRHADATEASYPGGFAFFGMTGHTNRWYPAPDAEALAGSLGLDDSWMIIPEFYTTSIPNLPSSLFLGENFSLTANPATSVGWTGSAARKGGTFSGAMTLPLTTAASVKASASGVFLQEEAWGKHVGSGLVKIPTSTATTNPSFRTIGLVLKQQP